MPGSKLPVVGMPPSKETDEPFDPGAVVVDSPGSASKFGFTWPSDARLQQQPSSSERPASSSASEHESRQVVDEPLPLGHPQTEEYDATPTDRQEVGTTSPKFPGFSRAYSMPSQLGHLQNPCRDMFFTPSPPEHSTEFIQFCELSLELAASVQMVVQTLLQVTPAQMLDPAREQFSACSFPVPTPSMSAVLTSLKNLNYMSGNMAAYCTETIDSQRAGNRGLDFSLGSSSDSNDFDIGELLQSVGDVLSGAAANAGVDLVLFHGDVGVMHVSVKGDESGLSFALSHIIRQIINTAQRGDSIEIGLLISPNSPRPSTPPETAFGTPPSSEWPVRCTFDISHKFSVPDSGDGTTDPPTPSRCQPAVHSTLLQGLLRHLGASLESNLQPKTFPVGRAWELTLILDRGSLSILVPPATPSPGVASPPSPGSDTISDEPTLKDLIQFSETLREKKAVLYAGSKGSFAHHLTSYLTAWGLDVSHVSRECGEESPDQPSPSQTTESEGDQLAEKPPLPGYTSGLDTFAPSGSSSASIGGQVQDPQNLSFILIDDDVDVFRERLRAFQADQPHHLHLNLRKQSLATSQRRLSHHSHRVPRPFESSLSVVIVHFTSLANFKLVKDAVYSASVSFTSLSPTLPEVMIVPKPAGPIRFLTALYMAVKKPTVDPYFSPIATSPTTPGPHLRGSFSYPHPKSPTNRPPGTRSNSERSFRSAKDTTGEHSALPQSPLSASDASKEYFPETAVKLGPSASSGLVVQSLDGQPAGIIFQPRARSPRKASAAHTMERERNQLSNQRVSSPRRLDGDSRSPLGNASISTILATPMSSQQSQSDTQEFADGASPAPPTLNPNKPNPLGEIPRRATYTAASSSAQRSVKRPSMDKTASVPPGAIKTGKGLADANVVPPISVLIVDDNPINQTILSTFMKKKSIKYDVAKNGQEAVQKWRTGGFHLILMDIQMPVMDGIQATKEIRRLEKENASAGYPPLTPQGDVSQGSGRSPNESSSQETRLLGSPYRSSVIIVALTASSLQSDRVAALAAGCNDFLTKPVSLLWLNNKITEWGSIKALQMWAGLRSDVVKGVPNGQDAHTRHVAERLHLPHDRTTPSPGRAAPGSSNLMAVPSVSPPAVFQPFRGRSSSSTSGDILPQPSTEHPLRVYASDEADANLKHSEINAAHVADSLARSGPIPVLPDAPAERETLRMSAQHHISM